MGSKVADRIASDHVTAVRHKLGPHTPPTSILLKLCVQSCEKKKIDTHELLHINKLYLMKKGSQFFLYTQETQFF